MHRPWPVRIRGHLDEVHIAAAGFDHEQAVQTLETARSAQSSRGRGVARRSTATSCRRTSNSAFLEAPAEQYKPAADPDEDQIEQTERRAGSSWPAADLWRIAAVHRPGILLAPEDLRRPVKEACRAPQNRRDSLPGGPVLGCDVPAADYDWPGLLTTSTARRSAPERPPSEVIPIIA